MNIPILYTFRRCPFAIRARSALYFSKTKFEIREVLLSKKPPQMIEASQKGTVPILVLKDLVFDESFDIVVWSLNNNDELNLLNPYKENKKNTIRLISKIDNEFKYHLDRYKYSSRYENDHDFLGKLKHRNIALSFLNEIEEVLKENTYLYQNKISILDLCIFPLIRQFKIADIEWFRNNQRLKNINSWLEGILNEDFFKIIMRKYKPWESSKAPEYFSYDLEIRRIQ